MKKILALLLVAVMIVSFCAACAKNTTPSTTTETTESNNTETTPAESTDTEEVPDAAEPRQRCVHRPAEQIGRSMTS